MLINALYFFFGCFVGSVTVVAVLANMTIETKESELERMMEDDGK